MGRPREHDLDEILDAARRLWVGGGASAVTIRALSREAGVSNGAVYHAFGSRDGLLAQVWSREAERFLSFQVDRVSSGRSPELDPVDAVVAAATATADYARQHPDGARLLLSVTDAELLEGDLTPDQLDRLMGVRRALAEVIAELAVRLWGRRDRAARAMVGCCLVELPAALLRASAHTTDALARITLERAVRGVVAQPPPG